MFDVSELTAKYGFIPANHKEPVFFPVAAGPIYDQAGKEIPGHQRIYREDSGDTLGVHTDKYALVPYERNFALFEDAIRRSTLPWKNMLIGTDFSNNGGRIFRQYLFPDTVQRIDVLSHASELALRIVMFDSYNGESSFVGKSGFFDFVCANESVSGKSILDVRFRHTGLVEERIADAAARLVEAGEDFLAETIRLQKWPAIDVNADLCEFLIKKLPQSSPRLVDELLAQWGRIGGQHLWDFHSMMTSWSTHHIPPKTKADRQRRVAMLVECDEWKSLEA